MRGRTTRIVTDSEEIAALGDEWAELLETTRCHRAFSSHAFYVAACTRRGTPMVVTLREGRRLDGILPLFGAPASSPAEQAASRRRPLAVASEDRSETLPAQPARRRRSIEFPTRMSDYNDAIVRNHDPSLAAILLEAALDEADSVTLMQLRDDSALLQAIRERSKPTIGVGTYATLHGYDHWLSARSRAFRKSLFRAQREAEHAGLIARELTDVKNVVATFLPLHLARQNNSIFALPPGRAFIDAALNRLFAERRLRIFGLFDNEQLIAIDLCMVGYNALCSWNGGFLPHYESFAPGKLLLAHEIRVACQEGLAEFDLLRGGHAYKAHWASERRELVTLTLHATAREEYSISSSYSLT